MKRVLIVVSSWFALTSTVSAQNRWMVVHEGAIVEEIDSTSIARMRDGIYRVWTRTRLPAPAPPHSRRMLGRVEVNCATLQSRTIQARWLDQDDRFLMEMPVDSLEWSESIPDSPGERLLRATCAFVSSRPSGSGVRDADTLVFTLIGATHSVRHNSGLHRSAERLCARTARSIAFGCR